ncbi:MAG TPA: TMEM165/GDT1 family protein [Acidimicrobiales bacterium]
MNPVTAVTAFLAVFPAELPDKTMFATVVMTARFGRPRLVWFGATLAFAVQVAIAVAIGSVLSLLPDRPVRLAVAALFATGAVILWRDDGDEEGDATTSAARSFPAWRVVGTVFGVVFLAEWGDLTQLATASLAASTGDPLAVYIGSLAALSAVAAIAAIAGQALLRVLPERVLRRVAAGIFAVLALVALVEAIRG